MVSLGVRSLFALLVIFVTIQVGLSLECYSCNTPESGACGTNFKASNTQTTTCQGVENYCIKGTTNVNNAVAVTIRRCGTKDLCSTMSNCHACNDDLCNASTNVIPSFAVTSIVALISGYYFFGNY